MSTDTPTPVQEYAVPAGFELGEDDNLARLAWRQAAGHPGRVSFESYADGGWHAITAEQHLQQLIAVARGLIAAGVQPGDRVALICATRYEWLLLDSATWAAGAVSVPIYPSSSAAQIEWIVRDSAARILIVENDAMRATADHADLPDVQLLVVDDGAISRLTEQGQQVSAADVEARAAAVTIDSVASIVYTSGTTGRPKGCVVTHANLAAEARALLGQPIGAAAGAGKRTLMFLPLAHVLARAVTYAVSEGGSTVGFWPDTSTLVDKLGSFRPNLVLGVPRVFEKVHEGVRASAHKGGRLKAEVFRRAERVAIQWSKATLDPDAASRPGLRLRAEHAVFDRLVYRAVRAALGGECDYAISGGGAMRADLQHFFIGLGVPVYEGYGLTETCAAITVNEPGATRIGTVGRPVRGNAVRIAADGEIQLKGLVVFAEYWQNPQATQAAFDQGWFRTGDLGQLNDGFLTITGRQKEIIVTAGGKNVAPGPLEEILRTCPVVGHAVLIGDGRPFVSALITLDPDGAAAWAKDNGLDGTDLPALAADPTLHAVVQSAVDEANGQVSHAEGIKKFVVLPQDFSEETGELTATLKVKRHVVGQRYQDQIEGIYRHRRHN